MRLAVKPESIHIFVIRYMEILLRNHISCNAILAETRERRHHRIRHSAGRGFDLEAAGFCGKGAGDVPYIVLAPTG